MKRPQTKFHAHTMRNPKLLDQKKVKLYHEVKIYGWVKLFLQHSFFLFIDILLKLQQHVLICFCKFSCNSV